MTFWVLIWLGLSAALLYFMGWTLVILYRQKKAWKSFAERRKLRYKAAGLMAPPEVAGVMEGYTVSLFTGEHISPDIRKTRRLTAIEIKLASLLPADGGFASGDMVPFLHRMGLQGEFKPDSASWKPEWVAASDSPRMLAAYLTPSRLEALAGLMRVRGGSAILIFRGDVALLRLDLPDPLDNLRKIEALLKKMIDAARILELVQGESGLLKAESLKGPLTTLAVPPVEAKITTPLELEDEGDPGNNG